MLESAIAQPSQYTIHHTPLLMPIIIRQEKPPKTGWFYHEARRCSSSGKAFSCTAIQTKACGAWVRNKVEKGCVKLCRQKLESCGVCENCGSLLSNYQAPHQHWWAYLRIEKTYVMMVVQLKSLLKDVVFTQPQASHYNFRAKLSEPCSEGRREKGRSTARKAPGVQTRDQEQSWLHRAYQ